MKKGAITKGLQIGGHFLNILFCSFVFWIYNHGKQLMAKLQKMALSLTPQAMYNQFKRPSTGSVSELYYIYRKT